MPRWSTLEDRFWAAVDASAGANACWPWTKGVNECGYGIVRLGGRGSVKTFSTHRFSWSLHNQQEIPDGLCVLHSCDNPPCCNPAHLRLGTQTENVRDMDNKNRRGRAAFDKKLSATHIETLIRLGAEGRGRVHIANQLGIRPQAVAYWTRKLRITLVKANKKLTDAAVEEIYRLWDQGELNQKQIGARIGVSGVRISQLLKKRTAA